MVPGVDDDGQNVAGLLIDFVAAAARFDLRERGNFLVNDDLLEPLQMRDAVFDCVRGCFSSSIMSPEKCSSFPP